MGITVDLYAPTSSPGGLCNRLRAIGGGMTLAQITNLPLKIHWSEQHRSYPGPLSNLIDDSKLPGWMSMSTSAIYENCTECPDGIGDVSSAPTITGGKHPRRIINSQNDAMLALVLEYYGVSNLDTATELFIKSSWRNVGFLLRSCVAANVTKRKTEIQSKLGARYIGLHVRLTDLVISKKSQGKNVGNFPDNYAEELAKPELSGSRVYLATDSIEGLDGISRSSNLQIIHLPRERFLSCGHRLTSNEDALVDLLLLVESAFLVGTSGSSFSETAIRVGGQKSVLVS